MIHFTPEQVSKDMGEALKRAFAQNMSAEEYTAFAEWEQARLYVQAMTERIEDIARRAVYPERMTAKEYRGIIADLSLSQISAAKVLDVSPRTGQHYAANGPSGPAAVALRLLMKLSPYERGEFIRAALSRPHSRND